MDPERGTNAEPPTDFAELALQLLDASNEVDRLEAQGLVAEYVRTHGRPL